MWVYAADGTRVQNLFTFAPADAGGARGHGAKGPVLYASHATGTDAAVLGFDVGNAGQIFNRQVGSAVNGVRLTTADLNGDAADEPVTAVTGTDNTEIRIFAGSSNVLVGHRVVGDGTPADGVAILSWGTQRAIGVLAGGTVTAYTLAGGARELGQRDEESWGKSGSSSGGVVTVNGGPGGNGVDTYFSSGGTSGGPESLDGGCPERPTAGTLLQEHKATWVSASDPSEDVTVTTTVAVDPPDYPGQYLWEYHVHNNSYSISADPVYGVGNLEIWTAVPEAVENMDNSMCWDQSIGELFGAEVSIAWMTPDPTDRDLDILSGGDGDFWFTTLPMATVTGGGGAWDPWLGMACDGAGKALAPQLDLDPGRATMDP